MKEWMNEGGQKVERNEWRNKWRNEWRKEGKASEGQRKKIEQLNKLTVVSRKEGEKERRKEEKWNRG